jgi:DNA-binding IclR family transcriptional regulator
VYTHKLDGHDPFVMKSRVGGTMPLHCTGIGKALLAHLPDGEAEAVLAAGLPRRTSATLTDARALRTELQAIRERGYSVDDEENEPNIRCIATIVPETGGQPLTALSISTVTFLTTREQLLEYVPVLQEAARRLAAARPPG